MMTPKRLTVELDNRLGGPHADEHTAAAADLAAECVRFLNYATGSHSPEGLVYPATVYAVTADLSAAATRMPQLFDQLATWLADQAAAGMLATDDGTPIAEATDDARLHLLAASAAAGVLAADLSAVQNTLAIVNGRGPNRQTGGES